MIEVERLTKRYGNTEALKGIDLLIKDGEFYGFLGPNGAGKTTTVKIMAGLLMPTSGRVLIGGHDIGREPLKAKKIIGFIPDRPYIYEKLTAYEFLTFTSKLFGVEGKLADRRIDEYLEMFSLARWKNELIDSFSHGMKQKTVITAALIHSPKVIIVDEPMVGLDPRGAKLVKSILKGLCAKGTTVFMSTHSLPVAEELCDRIGIILEGRLVAEGSMENLREMAKRSSVAAEGGLEDIFLSLTGDEEACAFPPDILE